MRLSFNSLTHSVIHSILIKRTRSVTEQPLFHILRQMLPTFQTFIFWLLSLNAFFQLLHFPFSIKEHATIISYDLLVYLKSCIVWIIVTRKVNSAALRKRVYNSKKKNILKKKITPVAIWALHCKLFGFLKIIIIETCNQNAYTIQYCTQQQHQTQDRLCRLVQQCTIARYSGQVSIVVCFLK